MPKIHRAGENPDEWMLEHSNEIKNIEKNVDTTPNVICEDKLCYIKFIGNVNSKYTNPDKWLSNLEKNNKGSWCVSKGAGKIYTPNKDDIIAVRFGSGNEAMIVAYVKVIENPSVSDEKMTEGFDRSDRSSRSKGNLNMEVSLIKKLDKPIKESFISKDIPNPNKNGVVKRQTTFKPISHVYLWTYSINTNLTDITKI